ncbi:MAG: YHS domain-containing (seleno)protein [Chitinophagaceae bacterium]
MKRLFSTVLISVIVLTSHAQSPSAYCNQDGVAIKGFDPVAYFTDNAATEGDKKFSFTWQGSEWHFKNEANMEAFKKDPAKYAPQFGGYCAYGASQDHKSPTDPKAFTILDSKLYLNYNPKVKEVWIKDTKGYIQKADSNWVHLKDKNN